MAKYPPLTPSTNRVVMILRAFGALVLIGTVWLTYLYLGSGDTVTGIRILVGGLSFVIATWMSPYSPWFLVFLGAPIIILPIVSGSGFVFLAIAIAGLLWLAWRRVQPVDIDPAGVRRVADDAVMPGAVGFVDAFEGLGWSRVGALAADVGRIEVTIAVLTSPNRDTYAEVTDVVMTLTSVFDEGRTMVTRNSASTPMGAWVLGNDHRGAGPTQLASAHHDALELLRENGISPRLLEPGDGLIEFIIEQERLSIDVASGFKPKLSDTMKGLGAIDTSEKSAERVRQWRWQTGPDRTHLLD